jgi:hypothetical protein
MKADKTVNKIARKFNCAASLVQQYVDKAGKFPESVEEMSEKKEEKVAKSAETAPPDYLTPSMIYGDVEKPKKPMKPSVRKREKK